MKSELVTILRLFLIYSGEQWNGDIKNAILPGLHCWYCQSYQAPYGILWHVANFPFALLTPTMYVIGISIFDYLPLYFLREKRRLWEVYTVCSVWIWLQAPYDIPILWFTLLGLIAWPLVFLGPLAKFPFGSEPFRGLDIWRFVLSQPRSINDYQYYVLMGVVFIAVLVVAIRRRKLK